MDDLQCGIDFGLDPMDALGDVALEPGLECLDGVDETGIDLEAVACAVIRDLAHDRAKVEGGRREHWVGGERLVGGGIAPEPDAGRLEVDAEVPLVVLGLGVIDLGWLLVQRASPYRELLPVRLDPQGLTACFDQTPCELAYGDHRAAVGGDEGRGGLEDDPPLAELIEEGAFDVGVDPELVIVLAEHDPTLELWLVAVATAWYAGGVTCKLDTGQDRAEPPPVLLWAHRYLPHVDIEWLAT